MLQSCRELLEEFYQLNLDLKNTKFGLVFLCHKTDIQMALYSPKILYSKVSMIIFLQEKVWLVNYLSYLRIYFSQSYFVSKCEQMHVQEERNISLMKYGCGFRGTEVYILYVFALVDFYLIWQINSNVNGRRSLKQNTEMCILKFLLVYRVYYFLLFV